MIHSCPVCKSRKFDSNVSQTQLDYCEYKHNLVDVSCVTLKPLLSFKLLHECLVLI